MAEEQRKPKGYAEMTGELLREMAVLLSVFIALDVGLALWVGDLSLSERETILILVGDLAGGVVLAIGGMLLEKWR